MTKSPHHNAAALWMQLHVRGIELPLTITSVLARWIEENETTYIDRDGRVLLAPIVADAVPLCGCALGGPLVADNVAELMKRWVRWMLREQDKDLADIKGDVREWMEGTS